MAGRAGPPTGGSGGGGEEDRPTVFDESFIRAAQLEEHSARERLEDHTVAVRSRLPESSGRPATAVSKQGVVLAVVVLVALVAAVYLGSAHPYGTEQRPAEEQPTGTVIPLVPEGEVPGGEPADLYAYGPAADFGTGIAAMPLPDPYSTGSFSRDDVLRALTLAKDFVAASSLSAEVLSGGTASPVRELLGPEQRRQLDGSLAGTTGRSPPTSWLVRFDPAEVALADPRVRVEGQFVFQETETGVLEVTARHVLGYTVRSSHSSTAPASLFTVRREVRMHFSENDLAARRVGLRQTDVIAGPMDCDADPAQALHPLLAGERPSAFGPAGTDPYAELESAGALDEGIPLCGTLSASAQPALPDR